MAKFLSLPVSQNGDNEASTTPGYTEGKGVTVQTLLEQCPVYRTRHVFMKEEPDVLL